MARRAFTVASALPLLLMVASAAAAQDETPPPTTRPEASPPSRTGRLEAVAATPDGWVAVGRDDPGGF